MIYEIKNKTYEEKLDFILTAMAGVKILNKTSIGTIRGFTMKDLFDIVKLEPLEEVMNIYELKLKHDEYIKDREDFPVFDITLKGFDFIMNGGYVQQKKDEQESKLTAKKDRTFNKWITIINLIIGIAAIIISIFALNRN